MNTAKQPLAEGTKHDGEKNRLDLLPTKALAEVAKVLTFGANKYEAYNWLKGISYSRLYAASQRHLTAWWEGEDQDPETSLSHLAHASCCILFLLTYTLLKLPRYKTLDDRPSQYIDKLDN